jgi:hypothetical protein
MTDADIAAVAEWERLAVFRPATGETVQLGLFPRTKDRFGFGYIALDGDAAGSFYWEGRIYRLPIPRAAASAQPTLHK